MTQELAIQLCFGRKELEMLVYQSNRHRITCHDGETIAEAITRVAAEGGRMISVDQAIFAIVRVAVFKGSTTRDQKVQFDTDGDHITALRMTPPGIEWGTRVSELSGGTSGCRSDDRAYYTLSDDYGF